MVVTVSSLLRYTFWVQTLIKIKVTIFVYIVKIVELKFNLFWSKNRRLEWFLVGENLMSCFIDIMMLPEWRTSIYVYTLYYLIYCIYPNVWCARWTLFGWPKSRNLASPTCCDSSCSYKGDVLCNISVVYICLGKVKLAQVQCMYTCVLV